jgi:hypothetical protein
LKQEIGQQVDFQDLSKKNFGLPHHLPPNHVGAVNFCPSVAGRKTSRFPLKNADRAASVKLKVSLLSAASIL